MVATMKVGGRVEVWEHGNAVYVPFWRNRMSYRLGRAFNLVRSQQGMVWRDWWP